METWRRVPNPPLEKSNRSTSSTGIRACAPLRLSGPRARRSPDRPSRIAATLVAQAFLTARLCNRRCGEIPFALPRARPMKGRVRRTRTRPRGSQEKRKTASNLCRQSSPRKMSAPPQVLYSYDKIEVYLWAIISLRSSCSLWPSVCVFQICKVAMAQAWGVSKLIPKGPTSARFAVPLQSASALASPNRAPEPTCIQLVTNASFANLLEFSWLQMPRGVIPSVILTACKSLIPLNSNRSPFPATAAVLRRLYLCSPSS